MKEIPVGVKGRQEVMVTPDNTAKSLGSGDLPVFGTPFLCALIENTCLRSVMEYLEGDEGTVGTVVTIKHLAATPIGMKVWAESELKEVDGRRLVFEAKAYDETGLIGECKHERFIIYGEKFLSKAKSKLEEAKEK